MRAASLPIWAAFWKPMMTPTFPSALARAMSAAVKTFSRCCGLSRISRSWRAMSATETSNGSPGPAT